MFLIYAPRFSVDCQVSSLCNPHIALTSQQRLTLSLVNDFCSNRCIDQVSYARGSGSYRIIT